MIPRLGFGTLGLGKDAEASKKVEAALGIGYRLLDCARIYGTERFVGQAIASSEIPRDELYIASKVWNDRQIHGGIRDSVLESLDALGVGCLDLLLIHWPVPDHYLSTWEIFQEIQSEGLVRSIGVSNFGIEELDRLIGHSSAVPVVNQIEHHLYYQDNEVVKYCKGKGILCEAWAPFGVPSCMQEPDVKAIAQARGATERQIVLAWIMQKGLLPLPRTCNADHAASNAQALDVVLDETELSLLDGLDQNTPRREHIIIDKPSPRD